MKSIELVKFTCKLLDTKKATDIAVLDIRKLSSLGDYFVVASGISTIHVKALAGELEKKLADQGIHPRRVEGEKSAVWILLDYNDVIIHIFNDETRNFYCLERLWGDAPRLDEKDIKQ
ncbi:MAG: ribosome silencing factor [Oscillospiraceae bacterium]|nr:ribosome silencing factor [Oscillospiraceae bacterium]